MKSPEERLHLVTEEIRSDTLQVITDIFQQSAQADADGGSELVRYPSIDDGNLTPTIGGEIYQDTNAQTGVTQFSIHNVCEPGGTRTSYEIRLSDSRPQTTPTDHLVVSATAGHRLTQGGQQTALAQYDYARLKDVLHNAAPTERLAKRAEKDLELYGVAVIAAAAKAEQNEKQRPQQVSRVAAFLRDCFRSLAPLFNVPAYLEDQSPRQCDENDAE